MVRGSVAGLIWGSVFGGVLGAQTCTFGLSVNTQSFPIAGGAGTLTITASASSCVRTVTANVSWISINFGQTGTGNGSAGFTVASNNEAPNRSGIVTVGSQSITISQAGPPCNFAISPTSASIPASSQSGTFRLTGLAGCSWTAGSNASWLQLASPPSGMGPVTVGFSAQANPAATARSGAISIAGLNFTVNQAGVCAYALTPAGSSFPSTGGNGSFAVGTASGCAWTTISNAPWIRIASGQSGTGGGQVTFIVDANTGDARSGSITTAGQTFTVTQSSLTCAFTLTPGSASVLADGGSATFSVSGPNSCAWTAETGASWITIVSGASGSGTGVVAVAAGANPDSAPRSGTVTVGGQTFTLTQAAAAVQISAVNAASNAGGAVTPGMIVTLSTPGMGPAATVTAQVTGDYRYLTTTLGEMRVLFDGKPVPMLFAENGQCGAIVPYSAAASASVQVQVEFQGVRGSSMTLPVASSSPGLFSRDGSGSGPGLILDPMGNLNSDIHPAPKGSTVILYATGEGQTADSGVSGRISAAPFPRPLLPVSVTIDGVDAQIAYAGAAPGLPAGLLQINVLVPDAARSGAVPVMLTVGNASSQTGVTVVLQ
jgi:uncharacterized protein (TIGR03437 family)